VPEDVGERTEEATPRRRQEARERGHVPHSVDLNSALVLLGGLILLRVTGGSEVEVLYGFVRLALGNMHHAEITQGDVTSYFGLGGITLLKALGPFIGGLAAVAYLGSVAQTGFVFSGHPLQFRGERLNPVEGLRRLVSRRGLVRLAASIFKIGVIATVAFVTIRGQFPTYLRLVEGDQGQIGMFVVGSAFELGFRIAAALLGLAVLDFLYQRWQYEQDIRMTKQEVRDELRRMEGDPLTRDRRQRMQRQVAMQRMMLGMPTADVVVTGSTGLAVALRYASSEMDAPTVVAKGSGFLGERIVQVARGHGMVVVERKGLAKSLDRSTEVGERIPAELYEETAEVFAYVHELGRMRRMRSATA